MNNIIAHLITDRPRTEVWNGPSVPPRPVFAPETPEVPGKVTCRHCEAWTDLGETPLDRLATEWTSYVEYVRDKYTSVTMPDRSPLDLLDVPEPDCGPNKVHCRKCDHWTDLGLDRLGTLRSMWQLWVGEQQDRYDLAWRQSPYYQAALQVEMGLAAREAEEARQDRQREAEREERAARKLNELIAFGVPVLEARKQIDRMFSQ